MFILVEGFAPIIQSILINQYTIDSTLFFHCFELPKYSSRYVQMNFSWTWFKSMSVFFAFLGWKKGLQTLCRGDFVKFNLKLSKLFSGWLFYIPNLDHFSSSGKTKSHSSEWVEKRKSDPLKSGETNFEIVDCLLLLLN